MPDLFHTLLIVCPLLFLAGFADSVAGGGGVISVPAGMLAGIPIHTVYGTNKFAMSFGTLTSVFQYGRSGNVSWRIALFAAGGALAGSNLGARLALLLSERYLSYCLMVLLPAAALFLALNKGFGQAPKPREFTKLQEAVLAVLIGLSVGAYDGFFGPGAGTFYIILFCTVLGSDLILANGNAKVVNLASNIGALTAYLLSGKVWFAVGIPMAICSMAGNYLGSRLAIKNGARFIRPIMALMIVLLLLKIVTDFIL
ncbi:MAG: TSUP family transporter [Candidatus Pelethousia sp.]|nr:TSUP family transporter [Candidatus Pelethousia sp.]